MKESWLEKREKIRGDIAESFSLKSGISVEDFRSIFLGEVTTPPIIDFNTQYLGDISILGEIFSALSERTGLEEKRIKSHYHREETFAQFAEHLLRAGAYEGGR
ncbi:MAG: hypothetical protein GF417_06210 [Candidatus Latescibacteria bacterium]|nr:hypothetical protein [bacterium]MBD3424012.1 hypothetical protein [Candidatus Latescibacterota bacterium]